MELILIKQVKKLGKVGDIINVKNGFGRNWLLPQNIAMRATEANKALLAQQKAIFDAKNAEAKSNAAQFAQAINGQELIFIKQASDDNKLFGSLNSKEISDKLSEVIAHKISYSNIVLDSTIKRLGVFTIEVALHAEVSAHIVVVLARSESEAVDALRTYKIGNDMNNRNQIIEDSASA